MGFIARSLGVCSYLMHFSLAKIKKIFQGLYQALFAIIFSIFYG